VPYVLHSAHAASPPHVTSSCTQLPAGKDPTTMSPQQLQRYGIPPALTKMPRWKTIAHHLKHRFCFPSHTPVPTVQHGLMQPQRQADVNCNTPCIAGIEGDDTISNLPITFAHGSWVVPCSGDPALDFSDGAQLATWVGVGGLEGSGPLFRVGVMQQVNSFLLTTPGGTVTGYQDAAYTYFQDTADPNTANIQLGVGVNCGDQVDVFAWGSAGQPEELFAMDDTSGAFFDVEVNPNVDVTNYACAVEDPAGGNLLNFGSVTFSDCEFSNNGRGGTGPLMSESGVIRDMYIANTLSAFTVNGEFSDGSTFSVLQGCVDAQVDNCE